LSPALVVEDPEIRPEARPEFVPVAEGPLPVAIITEFLTD